MSACNSVTERASATPAVTVLAAASTADAVEEVAREFRREGHGEVRISTGPSNGLARQVLSGVPADLFLSASEEWADVVQKEGRAARVRPLLANRLVLIVPKGNPAGIGSPRDLVDSRVRHVALAGENVPAGKYADQALTALELLEPLVASGKVARGHDVRVTLAFVERGEADAGIVYATDAAITEQVEVVHEFPAELHAPIVYPAVLLADGLAGDIGREFFEFLASPVADEIFRRHGFLPVTEASP